jgi:hypothetical protein
MPLSRSFQSYSIILSEAKDLGTVELLLVLDSSLCLEYQTYYEKQQNKKAVRGMSFWERIKKRIRSTLEKIARENEQAFGRGRMDCCQLNKNEKQLKNH